MRRILSLVLSLAAVTLPGVVKGVELSEAQVKAALLYNFATFVQWPGGNPERTLILGVVGGDGFGRSVQTMKDRMPVGRRISVKVLEHSDDLTACDILFIGATDDLSAAATLARVGDGAVLTVGQSSRFTKVGGIIRLYKEAGKFRFEINVTRAQRAKLEISSKMLNLATIVREVP